MSDTEQSNRKKILLLAYVAAVTTIIAGIIHIILSTHSEPGEEDQVIFFLVGGILQVFWALPVIKGWHKIWQYVGIGGTAVMVILWFVTHMRGLTHGRGLGSMTLLLEVCQLAFIGLCIILLKMRPVMPKDNIVSAA